MSIDMGQADRTLRQNPVSKDDGVFDRHRERMRLYLEQLKQEELKSDLKGEVK
jgi:hypothetical protein